MSTIRINKVSYSGRNIVISNNKVIIDGIDVTPDSKSIKIEVTGDIDTLNVDVCDEVVVSGNAGSVKTTSGDVRVEGNVSGSVKTMSGDVKCGDIGGDASTMSGDIKRR